MRSTTLASVFALTLGFGQAYKVEFYKGEQCRGAPLGNVKVRDYSFPWCSSTTTQAQSAYISQNNKDDDTHQLLFFSEDNCLGDIVTGAAGSGCVTFNSIVKSVQSSKVGGSKRDVFVDSGNWMNSVHTVNNIYRMNNLTASDDDEDMDEGWLNIGLGRWIGIPEGQTAHQFAHDLEDMEIVERSWAEDDLLEMIGESGDLELDTLQDSDQMLPGTSPVQGPLNKRDDFMGVRCNRAARCAFATGQAVQSSYNTFAKIYDGLSNSRLWGVLNNGYVSNLAQHYYWSRTTEKLKASQCDKNDKQCLLDALADNFDEFPRRAINVRNEEVENFSQDVTGKVEWQASTTKPMKAMPFQC